MKIVDLCEKAVLLKSKANPLVRRVSQLKVQQLMEQKLVTKDEADKQKTKNRLTIKAAYGVSDTIIDNWITGRPETTAPLEDTVETICEHASAVARELDVFDKNWALKKEHLEKDEKWEFGERFGISWQDVQRIVDEDIWPRGLPGTGTYLEGWEAQRLVRQYEGIYYVYHQSPTGPGSEVVVLRSAMRVRYAIKIRNGSSVVRCKLHIPRISYWEGEAGAKQKDYKYGGVLFRRGDKLYWYFELPGDNGATPDNAIMITNNDGDNYYERKDNDPLKGQYMSVTRDGVVYSSKVLINRMHKGATDSLKEVHRYMRQEGPTVMDEKEGDKKERKEKLKIKLVEELGKHAGVFCEE